MRLRAETRGFTLIELLVTLFIIGVLVALILSATVTARNAAQGAVCRDNLSKIGRGLLSFYTSKGKFPSEYQRPIGGWAIQILPHLDYTDVYRSFDLNLPPTDPRNQYPAEYRPWIFRCPAATVQRTAVGLTGGTTLPVTHYVMRSHCLGRSDDDVKKYHPGALASEISLVQEAPDAEDLLTPWTLSPDAPNSFLWLGRESHGDNRNMLYLDGSVRAVSAPTISDDPSSTDSSAPGE